MHTNWFHRINVTLFRFFDGEWYYAVGMGHYRRLPCTPQNCALIEFLNLNYTR